MLAIRGMAASCAEHKRASPAALTVPLWGPSLPGTLRRTPPRDGTCLRFGWQLRCVGIHEGEVTTNECAQAILESSETPSATCGITRPERGDSGHRPYSSSVRAR